ncbi:hypothetical protein MON38_08610 [Hymenobacter sp. DH14]|uniref:DUF3311 domain-containing protein n=1 Tax=Hymenobacter cyanobacteriorum TaxID=2926463 RepID=A0A9X1VJI3_9BACT|nr:hypothetical protein [Hymenobacter cyanobacteriorum]MCI1187481.1 hypothetical protein [Hymenobacter cyanobacteriorum]
MIPPNSPASRPAPRRGPKLLFLAGLFGVLLNYPLLAVFDHDGRLAGVPVLYLYVLVTWIALVALTGWLVRKRGEAEDGNGTG